MVTRDHHALARALTQKLNISKWKKAAFALGNIEPDYNRISYMGHRSEYFSNGHSYQCRKKWIFFIYGKTVSEYAAVVVPGGKGVPLYGGFFFQAPQFGVWLFFRGACEI